MLFYCVRVSGLLGESSLLSPLGSESGRDLIEVASLRGCWAATPRGAAAAFELSEERCLAGTMVMVWIQTITFVRTNLTSDSLLFSLVGYRYETCGRF